MKKPRWLGVSLSVALVLSALMLAPIAQGADPRCGGKPGITYWQDSNLSGPSDTHCAILHNGSWMLTLASLYRDTHNLQFFANWNDRISSFQTFNWFGTTTWRSCFYDGGSATGYAMFTKTGNVTVLYVGSAYDNRIGSIGISANRGC